MTDGPPSLRERRRSRTRRSIQEQAMRLFAERGYDATTVADVASAAEVSSMTVFRYFPSKEDLVLADEYDSVIVEYVTSRPASEPVLERLREGLLRGVATLSEAERQLLLTRLRLILGTPALRGRHWDYQYATQQAVVDALLADDPSAGREFDTWVAVGACLAAASAALTRWADRDGRPDLDALMHRALGIVTGMREGGSLDEG